MMKTIPRCIVCGFGPDGHDHIVQGHPDSRPSMPPIHPRCARKLLLYALEPDGVKAFILELLKGMLLPEEED